MGKTHAFGTTLTWDGAVVASLNSIGGVEISVDTADVTTHDSPDAYKEYIAGLLDAGEVALGGFYNNEDATGQIAMVADAAARAVKAAVITFPTATGTTWSFNGLITSIKVGDAAVADGIPFSATIKITGKPTLAVAASAGLTTPFFALSGSAVLTPDAAGDEYEYVATVLNGVASITVTPTATAGVITVNGSVVATGVASSAIALVAGAVTDITIVVTETAKAPKTYVIHAVRAA